MTLTVLLFCIYIFLSFDTSICSTLPFPPLKTSNLVLVSVSLTFQQTQHGMSHFIAYLMTILLLIGMVFMIILEIFHGRISLNSVFLLLVVNFVSGPRLTLMYVSLIVNIRSDLILISMLFSCLCCCHSS